MPPAARVGDLTSHVTPLDPGSGSLDVYIGGQPAWRGLLDFHKCPVVDPSGNAHVGGVVSNGSNSVKINNRPAARLGDTIVEAGAPNSIASGCVNVSVGD